MATKETVCFPIHPDDKEKLLRRYKTKRFSIAINQYLRESGEALGIRFIGAPPDRGSGKRMIPKEDEAKILEGFRQHVASGGAVMDYCQLVADEYGYTDRQNAYMWLDRHGAFETTPKKRRTEKQGDM